MNTEKSQWKTDRKGRVKKRMHQLLICFILYVVIGMCLPFIFPKPMQSNGRKTSGLERVMTKQEKEKSEQKGYIVESNKEALTLRKALFARAKKRIIFSTFDIRMSKSTKEVFAGLLEAANRGVQVDLLVDGMYGMLHMTDDMFAQVGSHPNITIKYYNSPNILLPWTIHGRLHDKYIVVDETYLLMGGRNTFNYFLGDYTNNPGLDREVLLMADAGKKDNGVAETVEYFDRLFSNKVCHTKFKKKSWDDSMTKNLLALGEKQAKENEDCPVFHQMVPVSSSALMSNPTHIYGKSPWVFEEIMYLVRHGEKKVYVQTPYIVLSKDMKKVMAGTKKGLEKTLLVNSIAAGDNVCASADYLLHQKSVAKLGWNLWEYMGKHSTHGKSLLVDDSIVVIGSYNFDKRSTYVDTETMMAIRSEELNAKLQEHFTQLEQKAVKVDDNGEYVPKKGVTIAKVEGKKKVLIYALALPFQLFRFLI